MKQVLLQDILWETSGFAAGQSNMEFPLAKSNHAAEALAAAALRHSACLIAVLQTRGISAQRFSNEKFPSS